LAEAKYRHRGETEECGDPVPAWRRHIGIPLPNKLSLHRRRPARYREQTDFALEFTRLPIDWLRGGASEAPRADPYSRGSTH